MCIPIQLPGQRSVRMLCCECLDALPDHLKKTIHDAYLGKRELSVHGPCSPERICYQLCMDDAHTQRHQHSHDISTMHCGASRDLANIPIQLPGQRSVRMLCCECLGALPDHLKKTIHDAYLGKRELSVHGPCSPERICYQLCMDDAHTQRHQHTHDISTMRRGASRDLANLCCGSSLNLSRRHQSSCRLAHKCKSSRDLVDRCCGSSCDLANVHRKSSRDLVDRCCGSSCDLARWRNPSCSFSKSVNSHMSSCTLGKSQNSSHHLASLHRPSCNLGRSRSLSCGLPRSRNSSHDLSRSRTSSCDLSRSHTSACKLSKSQNSLCGLSSLQNTSCDLSRSQNLHLMPKSRNSSRSHIAGSRSHTSACNAVKWCNPLCNLSTSCQSSFYSPFRYDLNCMCNGKPTAVRMNLGGGKKCPRCDKTVYFAEEVVASGQKWHKRCLTCEECNKSLDSFSLTSHEGRIFCKNCYGKLFGPKGYGFAGGAAGLVGETNQSRSNGGLSTKRPSVSGLGVGPKCPRCGDTVYFAEEMMAIGKKWHKLCMSCADCNKQIDSRSLTEHDGEIFCKGCYAKHFGPKGYGFAGGAAGLAREGEFSEPPATAQAYVAAKTESSSNRSAYGGSDKCGRCGKSVYFAEKVLGGGCSYHKACFNCLICNKKLDSTNLKDRDGEIYCNSCYGRNFGPKGIGYGIGAGTLQTN